MLFLLGLPNKPPKPPEVALSLNAVDVGADLGVVGAGTSPMTLLTYLLVWSGSQSGEDAVPKTFKEVEQALATPSIQDNWRERRLLISVTGMYSPNKGSDRLFGVTRFSIECCGADAVARAIPVVSREGISHLKKGDWIRVVAELDVVTTPTGGRSARLKVAGPRAVTPTPPDSIPWIR
jgi:hypothetical protein